MPDNQDNQEVENQVETQPQVSNFLDLSDDEIANLPTPNFDEYVSQVTDTAEDTVPDDTDEEEYDEDLEDDQQSESNEQDVFDDEEEDDDDEEDDPQYKEPCGDCGRILCINTSIMCYSNADEGDMTLCSTCYWDNKWWADDENEDNADEWKEHICERAEHPNQEEE